MTAPSPDQPHAQEPAEGTRETGDAARRDANESEDRISSDPDTTGVSDYVPDA